MEFLLEFPNNIMAITESERVQIRSYMGASYLFNQLYPKLENAITNIQSVADGGNQVDSSLETLIRQTLSDLADVDAAIKNLIIQAQVFNAGSDDIKISVAHGLFNLRAIGRQYIGKISRALSCLPFDDYYSPVKPSHDPS